MTGTVASQFILFGALLASLVLYTPTQIGQYGIVLTIVYTVSHFSGLRVDGLLMAQPTDQQNYLNFGRTVQLVQTVLVFVVLVVWSQSLLVAVLGASIFYWYCLMLLNSIVHLQHDRIAQVTKWKVHASFTTLFIQVVTAFTPLGLLIGDAVGKWVHGKHSKLHYKSQTLNWQETKKLLVQNHKPLLYLNGATLGTTLCLYSPLLFVDLFFGLQQTASFFLVQRFTGFAEQVLGYSYHQLVVSESPQKKGHPFRSHVAQLFLLTCLLFSLLFIGIVVLVQFPLFEKWNDLILLFLIYVPVSLMQTVLTPVRTYLMQHRQWKALCLGELSRGAGFITLALAFQHVSFVSWVTAVSIGGACVSLVLLGIYHQLLSPKPSTI